MGRFEVQGIVSAKTNEPLIQFRQIDDEGNEQYGFQITPDEARELAQTIIEASANAVYDAALVAWANDMDPENQEMGFHMVTLIRRYRADRWGLPDQPKDWTE
jgi:hypothetical protein